MTETPTPEDPTLSEQRARIFEHMLRVFALVDEHGFAVQAVGGNGDLAGESLPFGYAYTVGCAGSGLPEFVVVGAPVDLAHGLLTEVRSQLLQRPTRLLADGLQLDVDVIETPVRLQWARPDTDGGSVFGGGLVYCSLAQRWLDYTGGGAQIEVMQILYPSPDGAHWPGEEAYPWPKIQPLLPAFDDDARAVRR